MLAQKEIFRKMAVKSTIFELQQSFLHIFGVTQNFQFNGGPKRGVEMNLGNFGGSKSSPKNWPRARENTSRYLPHKR